jgi:Predicted xylanase/chitin deacetylase
MKHLKLIKRFKPLEKIYTRINPFTGVILMFHRVVHQQSKINDNRLLEITPGFLESTILKYKNEGYEFVSLDDMLKKQKSYSCKPYVCFTFDDGYRDNLSVALPVLEKYQVPFAIYVTTNFIDQKSFLWWYVLEALVQHNEKISLRNGITYVCKTLDEKNEVFSLIKRELKNHSMVSEQLFYQYFDESHQLRKYDQPEMLSWDEIKMLQNNNLCTIASHGVTHSSLTLLTDNALIYELSESKKIIEERTGVVVKHFAYPYGDMNKKVAVAVKNAGYFSAVKIDGGMQRKFQRLYFLKRSWLYES